MAEVRARGGGMWIILSSAPQPTTPQPADCLLETRRLNAASRVVTFCLLVLSENGSGLLRRGSVSPRLLRAAALWRGGGGAYLMRPLPRCRSRPNRIWDERHDEWYHLRLRRRFALVRQRVCCVYVCCCQVLKERIVIPIKADSSAASGSAAHGRKM